MLKDNFLRTIKLLSIVFVASVITTGCKGRETEAKASGPSAIPVKLLSLQSSAVEDSSEFVGSLEALERVDLKPEIEGRIMNMSVVNGALVKKGTMIAQLRQDQPQAQYKSALAKANSARSARATAAAKLRAAVADRVRAAADVKLQEVQFHRAEQLVNEGVQARQQLDISRNSKDTAIAALRAAEEQVGAAKATLQQTNSDLNQAKADAAAADVPLQYKQVRSPITGMVGDFNVKIGDYATTSQTITTITRNDFLDLRISVPTNHSAQLKVGLPVELVDPNTRKILTTGEIYFISPQVNSGNQAILTKARFPNRDGSLRDHAFVKARVIWSKGEGILIPTSAVSTIGAQNFVFVAQKGEKPVVRQRPVELGDIQGQSYKVINGVKPGEEIAVTQILNLKDNTAIKPMTN
ncbi:MAG: efflux RND transporter periplasmic adaptor subunit [Rhizonema sp. NSF051]|nr:efflux RND transporter periplasmic adaptor subunit [Rhizonema sp. NSF051]